MLVARAAPGAHLLQLLCPIGHFKLPLYAHEPALNLPHMLAHRVILLHQLMNALLALLDDCLPLPHPLDLCVRPRVYLLIQCDNVDRELLAHHLDVPDHLLPQASHLVADPELQVVGPGSLVDRAFLHQPHKLVHLLEVLVCPQVFQVLILVVGLKELDHTEEVTMGVLLGKKAPVQLVVGAS